MSTNPVIGGRLSSASVSGSISGGKLGGRISVPKEIESVDYSKVYNKPTINGVELSGNTTSQDLYLVSENTTAGWNSMLQYIPKPGEICIYTDYAVIKDDLGNDIVCPGIKIGDGNSYLIDMPFVGSDIRYAVMQKLKEHEENSAMHVSSEDREFWNNKLNYDVSEEELILTRG